MNARDTNFTSTLPGNPIKTPLTTSQIKISPTGGDFFFIGMDPTPSRPPTSEFALTKAKKTV